MAEARPARHLASARAPPCSRTSYNASPGRRPGAGQCPGRGAPALAAPGHRREAFPRRRAARTGRRPGRMRQRGRCVHGHVAARRAEAGAQRGAVQRRDVEILGIGIDTEQPRVGRRPAAEQAHRAGATARAAAAAARRIPGQHGLCPPVPTFQQRRLLVGDGLDAAEEADMGGLHIGDQRHVRPGIRASGRISPAWFMPISATAKRAPAGSRARVSGPSRCSARLPPPRFRPGRRGWCSISLVVVLPTLCR